MTTKSEIVKRIKAKYPQLTNDESKDVVDIFLREVAKSLRDGGRTEIRGFGSFSTRTRAAGSARNPRTGETVQVDARKTVYFRAGSALNKSLN